MDYTTQRFGFKIKKTLRYMRLYGVPRTLVKIKGQYHMKKWYATLPELASPPEDGGHVGLIGCGNFAFSNFAYYLKKNYGHGVRRATELKVREMRITGRIPEIPRAPRGDYDPRVLNSPLQKAISNEISS